jgi:hypothetical protein
MPLFTQVRGRRILGSSTRKFQELVNLGDTLHPQGEYAPDVTKRRISKALLPLQEGEGDMIRTVASIIAMWVGSDRRER